MNADDLDAGTASPAGGLCRGNVRCRRRDDVFLIGLRVRQPFRESCRLVVGADVPALGVCVPPGSEDLDLRVLFGRDEEIGSLHVGSVGHWRNCRASAGFWIGACSAAVGVLRDRIGVRRATAFADAARAGAAAPGLLRGPAGSLARPSLGSSVVVAMVTGFRGRLTGVSLIGVSLTARQSGIEASLRNP